MQSLIDRQGLLQCVISMLGSKDHARLSSASQACNSEYSNWVAQLPRSAAELAHRGEHKEGLHWFRAELSNALDTECSNDHAVLPRPLLLYVCGLSGAQEVPPSTTNEGDQASKLRNELLGSRWSLCTERSNQGGAGSNYHWMLTYEISFEATGTMRAMRKVDNELADGSWSVLADCSLQLHVFDGSWCLQAKDSGTEAVGQNVAAFMIEEGIAQKGCIEKLPRSYLPLHRPNFSTMPVGGTVHGTSLRTDFHMVRLLLPELRILMCDFTHTSAEGACHIIGSNGACRTDYAHALFGTAQGSCGPAAFSRIDLRDTPLAIVARFLPTGCGPRGKAWHRSNHQHVLVAGTGGQGACAPTFPGTDHAQYPCMGNGHADQLWQYGGPQNNKRPFMLQLQFVSPEPDQVYGHCYDVSHAPRDWTFE